MSENAKKGILAAIIVVALAVAGYSIFNYSTQDKMIVERKITMPPGFKSEKERALEAQKAGNAPTEKEEKDLGGG